MVSNYLFELNLYLNEWDVWGKHSDLSDMVIFATIKRSCLNQF